MGDSCLHFKRNYCVPRVLRMLHEVTKKNFQESIAEQNKYHIKRNTGA